MCHARGANGKVVTPKAITYRPPAIYHQAESQLDRLIEREALAAEIRAARPDASDEPAEACEVQARFGAGATTQVPFSGTLTDRWTGMSIVLYLQSLRISDS
jgi:hypothetical protein